MSPSKRDTSIAELAGRHWIAGEWRSPTGNGFELRQRIPPFERLGAWPRGSEELLVEALTGSRGARETWRAGTMTERRSVLVRAAEVLRGDEAWRTQLARYLGLRDPELDLEVRELEEARRRLEQDEPELEPDGVTVVLSHWAELVGPLFLRTARRLAAGRAVCLFADERWPGGADAIARAFDASGIPAGLVSVLHGASGEPRDALLGGSDAVRGAEAALTLDIWPREPEISTYVVQEADDLALAATDVVNRAFGRSATLSGQRPGHVGRVLCHRMVFSPFTELLLGTLQTHPDVRDPVPLVDPEAYGKLRSMWELGLDEGATLIFGGESFTGGTGRSSDRRVWPAVFTNIEREMALFRNTRPAPLLCLVRMQSDQAAQELARDLR